jgi:hypothetical protein
VNHLIRAASTRPGATPIRLPWRCTARP